ncbi:MAG: serine hydrolase domain-containing protein [Acidobacteriota bacterium]
MVSIHRREFSRVLLAAAACAARLDAAGAGIDDTLRTGIAQRKIPAVAGMVATRSKTLYRGAFGLRDSSGAALQADSIFAIASMTKAITTVAALQLVEQGKVRLEEPVARFLPKLDKPEVLQGFDPQSGKPILRPARTRITLKHLLTHTSGLCYDTWDGEMFRYSAAIEDAQSPGPLMFEPGARWQYGTGVDWAGRLVETVSGMSLEDYFQAKILSPLEMPDTSFLVPQAKFDRLVSTSRRGSNGALEQDERSYRRTPKHSTEVVASIPPAPITCVSCR